MKDKKWMMDSQPNEKMLEQTNKQKTLEYHRKTEYQKRKEKNSSRLTVLVSQFSLIMSK